MLTKILPSLQRNLCVSIQLKCPHGMVMIRRKVPKSSRNQRWAAEMPAQERGRLETSREVGTYVLGSHHQCAKAAARHIPHAASHACPAHFLNQHPSSSRWEVLMTGNQVPYLLCLTLYLSSLLLNEPDPTLWSNIIPSSIEKWVRCLNESKSHILGEGRKQWTEGNWHWWNQFSVALVYLDPHFKPHDIYKEREVIQQWGVFSWLYCGYLSC